MVAELVKDGETKALEELLTYKVWLYIAGWIILFILGVCWQWRMFKNRKETEEEEEKAENLRMTPDLG